MFGHVTLRNTVMAKHSTYSNIKNSVFANTAFRLTRKAKRYYYFRTEIKSAGSDNRKDRRVLRG